MPSYYDVYRIFAFLEKSFLVCNLGSYRPRYFKKGRKKKFKGKYSEDLLCVSSRDFTTLMGYYRVPRRSPECDLVNADFASPLYVAVVVPLWKRLSSALIRSVSLAPTSLAALGLNCASGKVFPLFVSPFRGFSVISFRSLAREEPFRKHDRPASSYMHSYMLCHSWRLQGCVINCLLTKFLSLARGKAYFTKI